MILIKSKFYSLFGFGYNTFLIAVVLLCAGCKTKQIQQGIYVTKERSHGFALREDGTGWMVNRRAPTNAGQLVPLIWMQSGEILEIMTENPEGFPSPIMGRVRNVTAKSYEYFPAPDDIVTSAFFTSEALKTDHFRWTKWSRLPASHSKDWFSGMFQTMSVSGTNLPVTTSQLKTKTRIRIVERLRVVPRNVEREKHLLQVMDIFVDGSGLSTIRYNVRGFDRGCQFRSGFEDFVPIVDENRSCKVPTNEIADILRKNVILDQAGGRSGLLKPWHSSLTFIYQDEDHVRLENWPVRSVLLSRMWYDFVTVTNRIDFYKVD